MGEWFDDRVVLKLFGLSVNARWNLGDELPVCVGKVAKEKRN